jgi:hypothetical protein
MRKEEYGRVTLDVGGEMRRGGQKDGHATAHMNWSRLQLFCFYWC